MLMGHLAYSVSTHFNFAKFLAFASAILMYLDW